LIIVLMRHLNKRFFQMPSHSRSSFVSGLLNLIMAVMQLDYKQLLEKLKVDIF